MSHFADTYPYLLVVDLEATCDDANAPTCAVPKHEMEIVEIGAVLVETVSLDVVDEFQTFVRPRRHPVLTPFCTKLTSIRQTDVDAAPLFPEAVASMQKFVGARRALFCSWGDYDAEQFAQDAAHHGIQLRLGAHLNLKREFSKVVPNTTKKFGMAGALERVGLAFDGRPHRGIEDARNTARLLPWILGRREVPDVAPARAAVAPKATQTPRGRAGKRRRSTS